MYNNRLYEIIYILLSKPKVTCEELAAYFGVSRYTIMRDMETLTAAGVPVYLDKGRSGGIHLFEKVPQAGDLLSAEDEQAIIASLQALSMLSREDNKGLLDKLATLLRQDDGIMLCMEYGKWRDEAKDEDRFARIQQGILEQRTIAFAYIDTYGKLSEERVEPELLWLENGHWYLRGYSLTEERKRLYKMVRMNRIELGAVFEQKDRAKESKMEKKEKGMMELRLRIDGRRLERVYDEFCEDQIEKQDDGSFEVRVIYPDGQWLYDFLLSFGGDLEVLEPVEARTKLGQLCKRMGGLYQ